MNEKIYLLIHDRPFEDGDVLAIYRSKADAVADAQHKVLNDPLLNDYEVEYQEEKMTWEFSYKGTAVERLQVEERELLAHRRHS